MTQMITKQTNTLLTARQVREQFGNVSDMALWRWLQDENLNFPKPIIINKRRYWRAGDTDAFIARQAA
jgi:hypothetical protein